MQGLADGYFVLPYTLSNYLAGVSRDPVKAEGDAFASTIADVNSRVKRLLGVNGKRSVDSFHKELGHIMWDKCGMARNRPGLTEALAKIAKLREEFWQNVRVLGDAESLNQSLEKAGRVADFLEFAEFMVEDALTREESCGGHFREEYQIEGEAKRDDENFAHVAVWEYQGEGKSAKRHTEPLAYENVKLATRSYK
jgi:succinate dehydrogenase / fumarate reductase flavoprotein subunit